MFKAKGLGKGLDALFEAEDAKGGVTDINIYEIEPNPNQPRHNFDESGLEELSQSIKEHGVISPITLRRRERGYEIIAGERRWRAARRAGLASIPAVVLDIDDKRAYQLAMIENLQREDLTPVEEAMGYRVLMESYGMTQEQVALSVVKSRPAVANAIRLLDLPKEVLRKIEIGQLSAGHGRALLPLKDSGLIEKAAEDLVMGELSVRATENMVKRMLAQQGTQTKDRVTKDMNRIYLSQIERRLSSATGRKIAITAGKKKGKLYIEFYGNEDLDSLIEQITAMNNNKL